VIFVGYVEDLDVAMEFHPVVMIFHGCEVVVRIFGKVSSGDIFRDGFGVIDDVIHNLCSGRLELDRGHDAGGVGLDVLCAIVRFLFNHVWLDD